MTHAGENRSVNAFRGLGALETLLMETLWDSTTRLKVQEVVDALGPGHNYKTVMTVLNRLVGKGLLGRELDGRAYRYHSERSRDQFLRSLGDELVRGYLEAYGTSSSIYLSDSIDAVLLSAKASANASDETVNEIHGTSGATNSRSRGSPLPIYYDEVERRPSVASVVGIAALLQIITFFIRRRR